MPVAISKLLRQFMHVNWTMAHLTVVSGVNFLTGLLLARVLGISEFGVFSLAWVVVLFVFSLQFAMVSAPMMSIAQKIEVAVRPSYFGSEYLQHLILAVASALIIWPGVIICGSFIPDAWYRKLCSTAGGSDHRPRASASARGPCCFREVLGG